MDGGCCYVPQNLGFIGEPLTIVNDSDGNVNFCFIDRFAGVSANFGNCAWTEEKISGV